MDCPQCGAVMRERDRAGVKIDFCPDCKGVWLDRGELDKIVAIELEDEREVSAAGDRARRDFDDGDDDERELRPARRRSDEDPRKSKKSSFFEGLTEMFGGE